MIAMGMPLLDGVRQMAMTRTDTHSMGRNFSVALRQEGMERRPGQLGDRHPVGQGARHRAGAETARRRRRHHRRRRRRGHGRGRFRLVPDLVHPARQRAAGAHGRHEQRLGHLHAALHAARLRQRHRPRPSRSASPAKSSTATIPIASWFAVQRGHGTLPDHAHAVHARGEGVAPVRAFVVERRAAQRRCRIASPCSRSGCCTPRSIDRTALEPMHAEAQAEVDAAVAQAMREPKPQPEDVERHTYAPSAVDRVYPGDYTGLPANPE